MGDLATTGPGPEDPISGRAHWADQYRRALVDSKAVRDHGQGVNPGDLAAYIESLAAFASERVQGIGAKQYGGALQQFETKSVEDLKIDMMEEAADLIAYAAMILIKIEALESTVESTQSVGSA